jgi:hypothetical protein
MTSQNEQLLKKEINTYGNKIVDLTRLFIIGGISEETRNKRYKEVGYKLLSKVKEARLETIKEVEGIIAITDREERRQAFELLKKSKLAELKK